MRQIIRKISNAIAMIERGQYDEAIFQSDHTKEDILSFLNGYVHELDELNDAVNQQPMSGELSKAVYEKYTELWLFQSMCHVPELEDPLQSIYIYSIALQTQYPV